jgi:hypothetical protein
MAAKKRRPIRKITLIHSKESVPALQARYPRRKLQKVQLVVRAPDKPKLKLATPILCGCRRICVMLV